MAKKIKALAVLSKNYRELIFVFAAFTLLVLAAYFSVGRILRTNLLNRAEEIINTAGANVRAGLSEAETTLNNSYHTVQRMIEENASQKEILDYLVNTTEWLRKHDHGLLSYNGIYGYIRGELMDGMGINPSDDYIPQRRPWYQAAIRSGKEIAYTVPYTDWNSNKTIVSVVQNVDIENGEVAGVLAMDISINWLMDYIDSLALESNGYGMLLNQNMTVMAHPNKAYMGIRLYELGGVYEDIAHSLFNGEEVFAHRIKNFSGGSDIVFFNSIFNGWYVGVIVPYTQFYRDLYITGLILAALGIVLSLSLCYILLRLSAAKMHSDEESKAKSSFLAHMSHEIRTPMNAIIGMAELALRDNTPDIIIRKHLFTIKQASGNLLSIINDILDFSKIESGKLEIVPANYLFSSLINDVISIIRMKVIDSRLHFVVNIDCNIPNVLYGDEIRIRQVLLNLLSNAVKYTDKGYVSFTVDGEIDDAENVINLTMTVTDSGKGIKPEDMEKLFIDFVQVNMANNKGIEGTGLGLAITRNLVRAMGGDVLVTSKYGSGSTFTATIPQKISEHGKIAVIENADEKQVLVYEPLEIYANSIVYTVDNLGVDCTLVSTDEEFCEELETGTYNFAFIASSLYENSDKRLNEICNKFKKDVKIVLLAGFGESIAVKNFSVLNMPVYSVSIANILNGNPDVFSYNENSATVMGFVAPQANVLIVDDINTNLMVAEGLLMPYQVRVEMCTSGKEAIKAVSAKKFDLVLMDHMMPEMDGIEAAKRIRALDKNVPIVALTANAVSGMKEMFLQNGFNDYLSKPIDLTKLNNVLEKWLPKEKQKKVTAADSMLLVAEPVKADSVNPKLLKVFRQDAIKAVATLRTTSTNGDIKLFTTTAHAMKSALANIEENEKSAKAFDLEKAGLNGDTEFIAANTGAFIEMLEALIVKLSPAEPAAHENADITEETSFLAEQLQIIKAACEDYDDTAAYAALDRLKEKPWKAETSAALDSIHNALFLHSDFEEAAQKAQALISM